MATTIRSEDNYVRRILSFFSFCFDMLQKETVKAKFQHLVRELGKVSTKSGLTVPKEAQVSMDFGNKMIFCHKTQKLMKDPLNNSKKSKSMLHIMEVSRKKYKLGAVVKYFSQQKQRDNTRTPKLGENNELKLYNKNGIIYDTYKKAISDASARVMYAIRLDGKIVTHQQIEGTYHSTLLASDPGICFGTMAVKNGKITYISNHSGHYKPTEENLYKAIKKLDGLFTDDAVVVFHHPSFNENGNLEINKDGTGILYVRSWCTVKQFIERIDNGVPIVPERDDRIIIPEVYFQHLFEYNESYKNKLILSEECKDRLIHYFYEPVPVFNGNVKIAIEHSIRKFIGAGFGHKPTINFDQEVYSKTISFCDKDDALNFSLILDKYHYDHELSDNQHVISISNIKAYGFFHKALKIEQKYLKIFEEQLKQKNEVKKRVESIIKNFTNICSGGAAVDSNQDTDKITLTLYNESCKSNARKFFPSFKKNKEGNNSISFEEKEECTILNIYIKDMYALLLDYFKINVERVCDLVKILTPQSGPESIIEDIEKIQEICCYKCNISSSR